MAKNINYVSHKKSKVKLNDGTPQLPLASALVEGEIAVNYAEDVETLSIKNESGTVVTFSSDNYYTEKKLGSGFTNNDVTVTDVIIGLNERKLDASAYTPTDLSNYYTKSETSGASEIATALNNYYTKSETSGKTEIASAFSEIIDAMEENELIISNTLNYFNDKKLDTSAYTPTDLTNYYTKSETSGKTEIANALSNYYTTAQTSGASDIATALNGKTDTATTTALDNVVTAHTANTNIHLTTTEKGQLHTHNNKTYLDGITGTVGTMAYQNASSYSSATQVNTALGNKVDNTEYATFSAATNASIEDLSGQSETIAAALNYLNDNKLDASAYTPTDLSNYYTKDETSGKTEISNALGTKVNTADVVSAITSGTSASTYPVSTKAVSDLIKNNEEIVSFALNDLDDRKLDASAMTEVESAVSDLESIVGSGYTNTTITEVIENMDTAIAAALTDLDDKIGDIESILATI